MRRIIAFDHVSADGYFATEDSKRDWVVTGDELHAPFGPAHLRDVRSVLADAMKDPRRG